MIDQSPTAPTTGGVHRYAVNGVDRAVEIASQHFFDIGIEPVHDPPSFAAEMSIGYVGPITVGMLCFRTEVRGFAIHKDVYAIKVPLRGAVELRVGRSSIVASPGFAAVDGVRSEITFRGWETGTEQLLLLKIDQHVLESELRGLLGRDPSGVVRFSRLLDLRSGFGTQWAEILRLIAHSFSEPDGMTWNPLWGARLASTLMTGLLLTGDSNYRDDLDARGRPSEPAIIRRAVAFIEEHAHEPLTIPQIAAEVGCSARTLHRGFSDHLDTTPLAYITRVRMDRAHQDLLLSSPGSTSVAEIATQWGFTNLGRFAATYRSLYGRLPSATLRGH